jgi:hypothetical protein
MSAFRRFIVGASELCLVLAIVVGTVVGATVGQMTMQSVIATNLHIADLSVGSMLVMELAGSFVGAIFGFLIPALLAALLFLFVQTERNTKATVALLLGGSLPEHNRS